MWWQIFLGLTGGIILGYCVLLVIIGVRFRKLSSYSIQANEAVSAPPVSIIVPFRNERHTLSRCVQSLIRAAHGLEDYQIILVNDHSNDGSQNVAESLSENGHHTIFLMSKGEGKKQALSTGIEAAKFDWIFTADADCVYPSACITHLLHEVQTEDLDIGTIPVVSPHTGSLLQAYDNLESHGIHVITAVALDTGLFLSASGAALLYPKSLFQKLQPFHDNNHIPSGDDQFFLYAYRKVFSKRILFLKHPDLIVNTRPAQSWQALLQQRLRWAGKSSSLNDQTLSGILGLTMSSDSLIILMLAASIVENNILFGAIILWFFKMLAEVFLLITGSRFWNSFKSLKYLPMVTLIRPFFQILLLFFYIIGTRNYWKGRLIKNE